VPVTLFSKEGPAEYRHTVTGADGEFSFKNIAAGDYRVVMGFPGHTNGSSWGNLPNRGGVEVSVGESSTADIKVRAERGASITGKVSYPDGEPTVGAQVNVYMKVGNRWSHAPLVAAGAETDDRGIFRIYPLQAGEYIVSVIEQSLVVEERDGGTMETVENKSINPYFYLDASSLKNARIIQVDSGRETNNIDITLAERATYKVSGTITLRGKPLASVALRLNARDEGMSGPTLMRANGISTIADKDGHWTFKDIPDGVYDVVLDTMFSDRNQPDFNRFLASSQQVSVAGGDVLDVVIALTEGGRISGTIVVERNKPLPKSISLYTERIEPNKPRGYGSSSTLELDAKGGFSFTRVPPGENTLNIHVDKEYYVKSVTWNDRDLLRQTLKVEEGREVQGVVVVLSQDVGTLSGNIVMAQNKKAVPKASYILLPSDESKWNRQDAMIGGMTDSAGNFRISGAPGDYLMLAIPQGVTTIRSMDDVKKMAPKATRVSLKTTAQSEVEIVVLAELTPQH
jgi:hypothetical protein